MPLHPQVADALEQAAAMGFPPVTDITPEEARANARIGRSSIDAEVEPVGSVEDSSFPRPTGDVPIRIYTNGRSLVGSSNMHAKQFLSTSLLREHGCGE